MEEELAGARGELEAAHARTARAESRLAVRTRTSKLNYGPIHSEHGPIEIDHGPIEIDGSLLAGARGELEAAHARTVRAESRLAVRTPLFPSQTSMRLEHEPASELLHMNVE